MAGFNSRNYTGFSRIGRPASKIEKIWTQHEIATLIDLWSTKDTLYNCRNIKFSERSQREEALNGLREELAQQGVYASNKQIQEKMTSLRNYYAAECRKIAEAKKGHGSVYKSKWRFFDSLRFLRVICTPRKKNQNSAKRNLLNATSQGDRASMVSFQKNSLSPDNLQTQKAKIVNLGNSDFSPNHTQTTDVTNINFPSNLIPTIKVQTSLDNAILQDGNTSSVTPKDVNSMDIEQNQSLARLPKIEVDSEMEYTMHYCPEDIQNTQTSNIENRSSAKEHVSYTKENNFSFNNDAEQLTGEATTKRYDDTKEISSHSQGADRCFSNLIYHMLTEIPDSEEKSLAKLQFQEQLIRLRFRKRGTPILPSPQV